MNTDEAPATGSDRSLTEGPVQDQKASYHKIMSLHPSLDALKQISRVLCCLGQLPGTHHMSPLLAPALPLPGPPWPPAHTPQAAERQESFTKTEALKKTF